MAFLAAGAGSVALASGGWRIMPNWRPGGSALVAGGAILPPLRTPVLLPQQATILCLGDSLTYGADRLGGVRPPSGTSSSWRVETPYPDYLQRHFGGRVRVISAGYPGDMAADGLKRVDADVKADLAILMYGTNDANPRRWPGRGAPIAAYKAAMIALIARLRGQGAQILLLAPPPAATRAASDAIAPYRLACRTIAQEQGVAFADTLAAIEHIDVPFQYDALHLRAESTAAIGHMVAGMIALPTQ